MADFSLADYRWLTSEATAPVLRELQEQLGNGGQVDVRLAAKLRKSHSASQAHLLLEQVELRSRARAKFARPEQLFFTRKGLEQATDEVLAATKAHRFAELYGKAGPLVDICCGIGGDLLQLAAVGPAIGFDTDAATAHFAAYNLQCLGREQSAVQSIAASAEAVKDAVAWHIDPDRRPSGERTIALSDYEPGPEFLRDLLRSNPQGAVKIAPAAEVTGSDWPGMERQWLGSRGECRQQVLWFGELARASGRHTATVVDAHGTATSFIGEANFPLSTATNIDSYLYEPDAAVLAAHLAGALAADLAFHAITSGGGYLTASSRHVSPLLATFHVQDVLPFDHKKLKAYCREHQLGELEIKKRGVDVEPFKLRREILAHGENSAVILLAHFAGSVKAIVAQRVTV